jgi:hypothetical protein
MKRLIVFTSFVLVFCMAAAAQQQAPPAAQPTGGSSAGAAAGSKPAEESLIIPKGAKVFIASMPDNFNDFIKTAIEKKQVPVTVVENRDQADFEITGFSETQKAGAAKKIIMGSWHSRESASIKVANLKSGVIAFAYSYNTDNSARGKKSSSEACAKHLKEKIESGK